MCRLADDVLVCAAGRRIFQFSKHARCCSWFEQRRCDGRFGMGKIVCDCCAADACERAATVCLIDFVVVTCVLEVG